MSEKKYFAEHSSHQRSAYINNLNGPNRHHREAQAATSNPDQVRAQKRAIAEYEEQEQLRKSQGDFMQNGYGEEGARYIDYVRLSLDSRTNHRSSNNQCSLPVERLEQPEACLDSSRDRSSYKRFTHGNNGEIYDFLGRCCNNNEPLFRNRQSHCNQIRYRSSQKFVDTREELSRLSLEETSNGKDKHHTFKSSRQTKDRDAYIPRNPERRDDE